MFSEHNIQNNKITQVMRYVLMAATFIILVIALGTRNPSTLAWALMCMFMHNIIYSFESFYERILFLLFNGAMFLFLISRFFLQLLTTYFNQFETSVFGIDFTEWYVVSAIIIMLILSLLGLYVGFQFQALEIFSWDPPIESDIMQKVSLVIFYISLACSVLLLAEQYQFVQINGYPALYSHYLTSYPFWFEKIAQMNVTAILIYLATLPKKKDVMVPLVMFLTYTILSLTAGPRSTFILNLLMVFAYLVLRELTDKEESWMSVRLLIFGSILAPVLIVGMTILSYTRLGDTVTDKPFYMHIFDFLYSQGVSVNLIGYAMTLDFPVNKLYSIGPIIDYLINNQVSQLLFDIPSYSYQTVESAVQGHHFADAVSYLIYADKYVKGWGYGSSFLAELMHDGGYVAGVIGSFFYGWILTNITKWFYGNVYGRFFTLYIIRLILYAPRSTFSGFIVSSLSLVNIGTIVIITILSYLLPKYLLKKN